MTGLTPKYRLRLELAVHAHDEDEALAMAYGALHPTLLEGAIEELPIRPKRASADRVVGLAVDVR